MKTEELLDEKKSELRKILEQRGSYTKEQLIEALKDVGLSDDSAIKLLHAYGDMKKAEETAQNVWNTAWESTSGIDFSTDIRKSSDTEERMTQYFDSVYSRCAFLMAIKTIDPNEINDELLDKLYEEKISENDITNPVLKTTYHYYSESKAKDAKLEDYASRVQSRLTYLERTIQQSESDYIKLSTAYQNLQTKFQERISSDEKHYQAALRQIETLKGKVKQMHERGLFKIIGDKLTGLFANTKQLIEPNSELPKTLYQNKCEKIGMQELDENEILLMDSRMYNEQDVDRTDDELQH